ALVSAFSAPLSFLIAFSVMNATGITLNFLSLFSLILSLGLLVDDTVVIISAMTLYHRTGRFTPLQTGLLVWRDFLIPVFTTTITTVWAFLPLLLSTGIIGEFIKPIPIVVSSTLLASFLVAMFLTLPFIVLLLKPNLPLRVVVLLRVLGIVLLFVLAISLLPKSPIFILELLAFFAFLFITYQVRNNLILKSKLLLRKKTPLRYSNLQGKLTDGFISFVTIERYYRRILERILTSQSNRRKVISMVIIFSLFSYILLPLGFVKN